MALPSARPSQNHVLLIRQLKIIAPLDKADEAALATLPMQVTHIPNQGDFIREGARPDSCCFVLKGLVARYKIVGEGQRQILSFNYPGDLPDLQSLFLDRMDHGLSALGPAVTAYIPHNAVHQMMDEHVRVRAALTKHMLVDGSILRQWLANVGRTSALERIAHLLCEAFVRLRAKGYVPEQTFEFLPTQQDIGDAMGLSTVHVNRTLQELRHRGLLRTSSGRNHEIDFEVLSKVAGFDPAYLHMLEPPHTQPGHA